MKRVLLLGIATVCLAPAFAETGEVMADSSRVYDLDEVVVVSQSKEFLKMRQQPISSSVLTNHEFSMLNIRDLRDASNYVPSFVMPAYGSRYTSSMYVRGIGSRVNSPSLGIYVDDIPLLSKSAFNSYTYQLDRVDVLRGPQGTLYGQNTEGGLIRQYTKDPMKYQGTDIRFGVGTYFHRNAEVAHYHKFSDKFALSVAGFYNGQNGFWKNETTGDRADESNEAGGRLRMVWQPTRRLTVNLIGDYQWVKQNAFPYGLMDPSSGQAVNPSTNRQGNYQRHMLNTGLGMKYAGDWADLNYTFSWQYLKDDMLMDIDYRPQDYMHMGEKQLQNALSHELVLKSHQLGIWQGTTGFFFSHQWLKTDAPVYFDTEMNNFLSKTIEDYAYYGMLKAMSISMRKSEAEVAAMIQARGGCHITMEMSTIPGLFHTPQTNYGFFHESNLKLTDRLTATLGLRYDISQVSIDYATSAVCKVDMNVMGAKYSPTITSILQREEENSFQQWLPKFGLTYRIDQSGSNIYANVSKGYRAGGFNIQMFSDILQSEIQAAAERARTDITIPHDENKYRDIRNTISYKPEESWNYEIGTHLNLFDNTLHFDLSAYYMNIRNQQLSVFATKYGFGRTMVNAGKSYSCGVEATLRGSAFDNHLDWSVGYGYTHAVFKDYVDSVSVGGSVEAIDYKDKRVPFVPEHTFSAYADYRIDLASNVLRSVTIGANVSAQGKTWWDEANTYGQKLYAVMGAHIACDLKPVTVNLWARNLTNTNYNTFAISSTMGGTTSYFAQRGAPFQAGVDVNIHF